MGNVRQVSKYLVKHNKDLLNSFPCLFGTGRPVSVLRFFRHLGRLVPRSAGELGSGSTRQQQLAWMSQVAYNLALKINTFA